MILNNIAAANRRLFRFSLNINIDFNNFWHDIFLFRMYLNYIILIVWHDIILCGMIINKTLARFYLKLYIYI